MPKRYSQETKDLCRQFFVRAWTIPNIAKETGVDERTLYNWKSKDNWDNSIAGDIVENGLAKKINYLAGLDNPTIEHLTQLDRLCEIFGNLKLKMANVHAIQTGIIPTVNPTPIYGDVADNDPSPKKPRKKRGEKKVKNDISEITEQQLDDIRNALFFSYQLKWYEAKNDPLTRRNRFILKSRQIGATYYFAFEALDDAIRTGDNQIFLSASRDQAEVFKAYIIAFALEHFGVELKGQGVIKLSNGAELRFLSTNSRTAASYHGHLYVDECFYIPQFEKVWDAASGMAAHAKWRRTLFSTPSALSHQAYAMWSGENYNKDRNKKAEFDISHKALKHGVLGADKYWRHMVTIEDAVAGGCNDGPQGTLFDIEELKIENSKTAYINKFMCKFIDDANSIFNLGTMMTCYAKAEYTDYNENAPRPFGNLPVAIGYDPSRKRDNASMAILAIPLKPGGKWRVLKTLSFTGKNFRYQANEIQRIVDTHNVKHIGIDVTGIGLGVFELVQEFYPLATPITYSITQKTELVVKAISVISDGLFEYQAGHKEITQAFMMITQTTSGNGTLTYGANRLSSAGHADVAWAVMHALNYETIGTKQTTKVVFSD